MFELKNVKLCQSSRLGTFTTGLILFNLMRTYLINVHSQIDSVSGLLFVSLLIYVWSCDQVLRVIRLDKVMWERWYIPWTPGISSVQLLKCLCQPEQVHNLRQPFAANAVQAERNKINGVNIIIITMCRWEMSSVSNISQNMKQFQQKAVLKPLPWMINIDRSIDVLRDVTEVMHQAVNQRERGMFAICDGLSYQVFLTGIQSMAITFFTFIRFTQINGTY